MTDTHPLPDKHDNGFNVWRLVAGVFVILVLIGLSSRWYAADVTLPRYCEYPEQALTNLHTLMTEKTPAGEGAGAGSRRPYIIAARLLFLLPRESDEPLEAYLLRVRGHIEERCR